MTRASSGVLTVATLVASASLSGCVIHLNGAICNESEPRAEELSLGDATGVRVEARAGSLRVEGSADDLIKATGTACAASVDELAETQLIVRRDGADVVVETRTDPNGARLDVVVSVPDHLPVQVDDSSGSMVVEGVASLIVRDSSGSIDIDDVTGDVRVRDGSGSIDITSVQRDVIVEEDGSGSIDVADVGGDFVVREGGSGSVWHSGVQGRVVSDD